MVEILLDPFSYQYMSRAIWMCLLVSALCAALSSYLMLKGWSLMGDALAHSVVPGVVLAYLFQLPFVIGAFFAGLLATGSIGLLTYKTKLRGDTVIGVVFTSFFALGLLILSFHPVSVNIKAIILGNILSISDFDIMQTVFISAVSVVVLALKWKDFMLIFFDEIQAKSLGLPVMALRAVFFSLLSAAIVAGLQTVGAILVIAMVITPGAIAYLYTNRFGVLITSATLIGALSGFAGAYVSYFMDISPGSLIVCIQTVLFLISFWLAPRYGVLAQSKRYGA